MGRKSNKISLKFDSFICSEIFKAMGTDGDSILGPELFSADDQHEDSIFPTKSKYQY